MNMRKLAHLIVNYEKLNLHSRRIQNLMTEHINFPNIFPWTLNNCGNENNKVELFPSPSPTPGRLHLFSLRRLWDFVNYLVFFFLSYN